MSKPMLMGIFGWATSMKEFTVISVGNTQAGGLELRVFLVSIRPAKKFWTLSLRMALTTYPTAMPSTSPRLEFGPTTTRISQLRLSIQISVSAAGIQNRRAGVRSRLQVNESFCTEAMAIEGLPAAFFNLETALQN